MKLRITIKTMGDGSTRYPIQQKKLLVWKTIDVAHCRETSFKLSRYILKQCPWGTKLYDIDGTDIT